MAGSVNKMTLVGNLGRAWNQYPETVHGQT